MTRLEMASGVYRLSRGSSSPAISESNKQHRGAPAMWEDGGPSPGPGPCTPYRYHPRLTGNSDALARRKSLCWVSIDRFWQFKFEGDVWAGGVTDSRLVGERRLNQLWYRSCKG